MSLGIRQKLIIAFASTSLLITVIAFIAMLFSFRAGFLQYINDYRYQGLYALEDVIAEKVDDEKEWQLLINNRGYWGELIAYMHRSTQQDGLFLQQRDKKKNKSKNNSKSSSRDKGRNPPQLPFFLLDTDKKIIYGRKGVVDDMRLLPITINDSLRGYIAMVELKQFSSSADQVFVKNQTRYFLGILLVASVIALLMAYFLARWMVVPIQRLDKAMSALMQRDYSARVQYESKDEMGRLVRSFNQLSKALGDHDKSQQQWIADISHELRTPLATLRGEMEAIQEGVRKFTPERLQSLHEEALRLQRIVDDLHQLSLSDAGAMRYVFDNMSVVNAVEHIISCNETSLQQHHIAHELIITGDEYDIYGDSGRLSQLFYNLLQNSLRYTDDGGRLSIHIAFEKNKKILIEWQDSEPGVLDASLEKLFDRLYREEKSRNREQGGSGLGLSICRAIVEAHRGEISAHQSPLGGVMIRIELPVSA